MSVVSKARSNRIGLIAAAIVLGALLIAAKVHADGQGFTMIVQRAEGRAYPVRYIDPQFKVVCYEGSDRGAWDCMRYTQ